MDAIVNCGHCRVVRYSDIRDVNAPYFRSGAHHGVIASSPSAGVGRKWGARQGESTLLCVPIESSHSALSIPTGVRLVYFETVRNKRLYGTPFKNRFHQKRDPRARVTRYTPFLPLDLRHMTFVISGSSASQVTRDSKFLNHVQIHMPCFPGWRRCMTCIIYDYRCGCGWNVADYIPLKILDVAREPIVPPSWWF